jgi:hypothetical protein
VNKIFANSTISEQLFNQSQLIECIPITNGSFLYPNNIDYKPSPPPYPSMEDLVLDFSIIIYPNGLILTLQEYIPNANLIVSLNSTILVPSNQNNIVHLDCGDSFVISFPISGSNQLIRILPISIIHNISSISHQIYSLPAPLIN